jgi:hypothetical protein
MKHILRRSLLLSLTAFGGLLLQTAPPAQAQIASDMTYDVRNGDQQGKLMIRDTDLAFESLTDAKHSRAWKYADIRSLEKKRKEIRVRPFKGSKYAFQFKDNGMRDKIYDEVTQRILTARAKGKK